MVVKDEEARKCSRAFATSIASHAVGFQTKREYLHYVSYLIDQLLINYLVWTLKPTASRAIDAHCLVVSSDKAKGINK